VDTEPVDPLWAIACYFNPFGSVRRLSNFRSFRGRLGARLVAVELSLDGRFDLAERDADRLLRIQGGAALWQKERLLNLALGALPDDCAYVAWLDADIVFADRDWKERVCGALRRDPLVQVFDRLVEAGPAEDMDELLASGNGRPSRRALTAGLRQGQFDLEVFGRIGGSLETGYTPGHGWAARRSLLDRFGLYDAFVLGTGDKAIAAAAYGRFDPLVASIGLHPAHAKHYRAWAEPFSRAVDGRVGFCRNTIAHLWHGDLVRRRYRTRYLDFRGYGFDPARDLRLTESGAWGWSSPKTEMHAYVRRYLESRCEDGASDPVAP
jgi:hypothetical protein